MEVKLKEKRIICNRLHPGFWGLLLLAIIVQTTGTILYPINMQYYLWPFCLGLLIAHLFILCQVNIIKEDDVDLSDIDRLGKVQMTLHRINKTLLTILLVLNLYPVLCIVFSFFDYNIELDSAYSYYYLFTEPSSGTDIFVSFVCMAIDYGMLSSFFIENKNMTKTDNNELYKIYLEKAETGKTPWDIEHEASEKKKADHIADERRKQAERESMAKKWDDKYGICDKVIEVKRLFKDDPKEIRIYLANKKIIIFNNDISFSDILSYSISDKSKIIYNTQIEKGNSYAVTETNRNGAVGRAAVGNVLFGSTGAVVGALSAGSRSVTNIYNGNDYVSTSSNTRHDYTINLNIKDILNPIVYIQIGDHEKLMQEVAGMLNVIIDMNMCQK